MQRAGQYPARKGAAFQARADKLVAAICYPHTDLSERGRSEARESHALGGLQSYGNHGWSSSANRK